MAVERHNTLVLNPQTAADVWTRAAHVRAFRASAWSAHPPRIAERPAPAQPARRQAPVFPAISTVTPGRITVRQVLDATTGQFGTTVEALISDGRAKKLCRQRQVAMFVAMKLTGRSLPFVASKLGGRHHTTVLHGRRVVQELIEAGDAGTVEAVNAIVEALTTGGAHV